jgi:hypothetical protein
MQRGDDAGVTRAGVQHRQNVLCSSLSPICNGARSWYHSGITMNAARSTFGQITVTCSKTQLTPVHQVPWARSASRRKVSVSFVPTCCLKSLASRRATLAEGLVMSACAWNSEQAVIVIPLLVPGVLCVAVPAPSSIYHSTCCVGDDIHLERNQ